MISSSCSKLQWERKYSYVLRKKLPEKMSTKASSPEAARSLHTENGKWEVTMIDLATAMMRTGGLLGTKEVGIGAATRIDLEVAVMVGEVEEMDIATTNIKGVVGGAVIGEAAQGVKEEQGEEAAISP